MKQKKDKLMDQIEVDLKKLEGIVKKVKVENEILKLKIKKKELLLEKGNN